MFPNSGTNTLTATVPAVLAVGQEVTYSCMDTAMFAIMGQPTTNECNDQGAYGPEATCATSK